MADPQTIGLAVSAILGMAAHEGFKSVIGETAKDAYKALKVKLAGWASEEVEASRSTPIPPTDSRSSPRSSITVPRQTKRQSKSWRQNSPRP